MGKIFTQRRAVKYLVLLLLPITLILIGAGCAPRAEMARYDTLAAGGAWREAQHLGDMQIDRDDLYAKNNLLWHLDSATGSLFDGNFSQCIIHFDAAENLMAHYREQTLAADSVQTLAYLLANDTALPYEGSEYDGIMLNTYKALCYLGLGQTAQARVEWNRALDRQRRAKEFFAQKIAKEREAMLQKERQNPSADGEDSAPSVKQTLDNPEIDAILENSYTNLYTFQAYPDFINPMTVYLAGLFFFSRHDQAKAIDLLKEAYGMNPDHPGVQEDFQMARALLSEPGPGPAQSLVWVVFENGPGPLKEEIRLSFPLWIFSDRAYYTGIALPKLKIRPKALDSLTILADDETIATTRPYASMERVIQTEFKNGLPATVRRALFSALTKTYMQYQAQRSGGDLAGLLFAFYQMATTRADTRIWSSLPNEFQIARFVRPEQGVITIQTSRGKPIASLELPKTTFAIVYVKMAHTDATPAILVFPLPQPPH